MATRSSLLVPVLVLGTISALGCATKSYVRAQVQPVSTKVDQVSEKTQQQFKQTNDRLDQTSQKVQKNEADITATKETADAADSRSTEALNLGHQNTSQINDLHGFVAGEFNYKMSDHTVVLFGFNKYSLTADAKAKLDQVASDVQNLKRYYIAVEGYTDQIGAASYNDILSRKRAESVIRYLVGEHNVPIYRIHMVGLGEMHLIGNGKTRDDRTQSRRVELSVFVAPSL